MSDYETTQRKRNIIVGIFVVVAICALVVMIIQFGELPRAVSKLLRHPFQVFVQFPTAPGVDKGTPVRFCGYPIGKVTAVMAPRVRPEIRDGKETDLEYHQTVVALSIDKEYVDIPSNVNVKVMRRGLGSSYIELRVDPAKLPAPPRDSNRPETKYLYNGILLQGSTGMTFEELLEDLSILTNNANDIIGDPNNKVNLATTLANVSEVTKKAIQTVEEIQRFFVAGTNTSEELGKTAAELRLILVKVRSGQGTAAKLVNDGRLYENLLENTEQMQMLLQELNSFITEVNEKGLGSKW